MMYTKFQYNLLHVFTEKYILNGIPHVKSCSNLLDQQQNNDTGDN